MHSLLCERRWASGHIWQFIFHSKRSQNGPTTGNTARSTIGGDGVSHHFHHHQDLGAVDAGVEVDRLGAGGIMDCQCWSLHILVI